MAKVEINRDIIRDDEIALGTWVAGNPEHSVVNYDVPADAKELIQLIETMETYSSVFQDYRKSEKYQFTDLIIIDVDNKVLDADDAYSIDQAMEDFDQHKIIVSTTKSHQKVKIEGKGGPQETMYPPMDRFRIYILLNERIHTLEHYKQVVEHIFRRISVIDPNSTIQEIMKDARIDNASFKATQPYQPSRLFFENVSDESVPYFPTPAFMEKPKVEYVEVRVAPGVCLNTYTSTKKFFESPPPPGQRNDAFWKVASDLKRCRYSPDETKKMILEAFQLSPSSSKGREYCARIDGIYRDEKYGRNLVKVKPLSKYAKAALFAQKALQNGANGDASVSSIVAEIKRRGVK